MFSSTFSPSTHGCHRHHDHGYNHSSGCCLFTRQSKCYQTQKQYCSGPDTEWLTNPGPNESSFSSTVTVRHNEAPVTDRPTDQSNSRTTRVKLGPVCGLDPKFCLSPRTSPLMPWSIHDVTKWPICEHTKQISTTELEARHMTCEVTARPCCLGLRGGCILTTREHCDFVRGIYNEKAALCSQVNCLEKTCGMLPFANGRYPDQFYRVLTALFIHKGIPQLVVTVAIQLTCMRNLEKFIGWARVMFVYITSGCVGNFLAAYFEPYQVETGPTSSIVALWTFRLIHLLFYTQPVDRFRLVLCKHLTILLGVFLFGLLPWLDNFANLGGLISGVLSSFVLLPYPRLCFSFLPEPIGAADRLLQDSPVSPVSPSFIHSSSLSCSNMTKSVPRRRIPVELICFAFWLTFVTGLVFLFYFSGVLRCEWCSYFTCVPIALNLCDSFRPYLNPPDICSTQTW